MADEDKPKGFKRLSDYTEDPLTGFEYRRARRTMDVVDDMESDRIFWAQFKTRLRAWIIYIGLAAATWTAALTLKKPMSILAGLLGLGGP